MWEAFPELNRVVVLRLLGVLVERITAGGGPCLAGTGVRKVSTLAGPPWERLESKVGSWHRDRLAVVYVRQSTAQQVAEHQESTRLQYGLTEQAAAAGPEQMSAAFRKPSEIICPTVCLALALVTARAA